MGASIRDTAGPNPVLRSARGGPPPRSEGRMQTKFILGEDRIPTHWYNIIPDMPGPLAPVIHPGTMKPATPWALIKLFPMGLLEQEGSPERWIPIPEPVREIYRLWRPSPLYRARRLEQALG